MSVHASRVNGQSPHPGSLGTSPMRRTWIFRGRPLRLDSNCKPLIRPQDAPQRVRPRLRIGWRPRLPADGRAASAWSAGCRDILYVRIRFGEGAAAPRAPRRDRPYETSDKFRLGVSHAKTHRRLHWSTYSASARHPRQPAGVLPRDQLRDQRVVRSAPESGGWRRCRLMPGPEGTRSCECGPAGEKIVVGSSA